MRNDKGLVYIAHECNIACGFIPNYLESSRVFLGPKRSKKAPETIPVALKEITPVRNTKFNRLVINLSHFSEPQVEFPSSVRSHNSTKKSSSFRTTHSAAQPYTVAENSKISNTLHNRTKNRCL